MKGEEKRGEACKFCQYSCRFKENKREEKR